MTMQVPRNQIFFAFSPELEPVLRVKQGEEVLLHTHDCFEGQIQTTQDTVNDLDWGHVNPATGPVYIEGAMAGDVLRVDLLEMKVGEQASMVTIPGEGALGDLITQVETAILRREGNELVFKDKVRVRTTPMIGVIGVAPESGAVPNGTLFGAGDFHAAMGDGEIVVCGAETSGEVRFRAEVMGHLKGLPTPFIETKDLVAAVYSAPTVDEASQGAIHRMAQFLTDFAGIPLNDAGMLMSLVGQLKFCQVVDPLKTVRFEFPKEVLESYSYDLRRAG
jgi:amidase